MVDCPEGAELFRGHLCDGSHTHTPCAGKDTVLTGFYTPYLSDLILNYMQSKPSRVGDSIGPGVTALTESMTMSGGGDTGLLRIPRKIRRAKPARINDHLARIQERQRQLQRWGKPQEHRVKDPVDQCIFPGEDLWCSLVTLALHPADPRTRSPKAMDAVEGELAGLRGGGVWDEPNVKSSKEVLKNNPEAHIADLFSICGIKNYDGPVEDQIMKARIVLGGHNVKKGFQKEKVVLFEQTASHPSSMCAARNAVAYGMICEDGVVLQTDCDKAYIQSKFDGPETWVRLPKKWWPKGKGWENIEDPVCRLVMNLYGHPRAGNGWERHAEAVCKKHGFRPVPEWPSVFWHPDRKVVLVVYVDDLVAAGPKAGTWECLKDLRKDLKFSDPEVIGKYLSCVHKFQKLDKDTTASQLNMSDYLAKSVKEFREENNIKYKHVPTPYLPDRGLAVVEAREALPGRFGEKASHYLMCLLYGARLALPQLIVAVTRLASRVSKWNAECDDTPEPLNKKIAPFKNTVAFSYDEWEVG